MSSALVTVLLLTAGLAVTASPTVTNVAAWNSHKGQTHMVYDATAQRIYYMDNTADFKYLDTTTDSVTLIRDFSVSGCTDTGLSGGHPCLGITMPAPNTFQFASYSQGKIFSHVSGPTSPLVRIAGRSDCSGSTNADNVTATSQKYLPYGMSYDATTGILYFASQYTGFAGIGMVLTNGNFQVYSGKIGAGLYNGQFTDGTFRTEMEYNHMDDVDVSHATGQVMVAGVHGIWAIDYATGLTSSVINTNSPANYCTSCPHTTYSTRGNHVVSAIQHPNGQAAFFAVWGGNGGVWQVDTSYGQVCALHVVSHATAVVLTDDTTLYAKSLAGLYGFKVTDLDGCATPWTVATQDPAVAAFCDEIADKCTAMSAECDTIRNGHGPVVGAGTMSNQAGLNNIGEQTGGVTLSGNSVVVTAVGTMYCSGTSCPTSPDGSGSNGVSGFLLNGVPTHSLIARFGNTGPWQYVGAGPTTLTGTGPLTFAYNDDNNNYADNNGSWFITIRDDITNVADDCDASVAACNDIHQDCIYKVGNCPLV